MENNSSSIKAFWPMDKTITIVKIIVIIEMNIIDEALKDMLFIEEYI